MCFMNWHPEDERQAEVVQPLPTLKWAIPVDPPLLVASLEAYHELQPAFHSVRLCHRFGIGPLSKLSQELVDYILERAHRSTTATALKKWRLRFTCYQGLCGPWDHFGSQESFIVKRWQCLKLHKDWTGGQDVDHEIDIGAVQRYLEGDWECDACYGYDDQLHRELKDAWLDQMCLCCNLEPGTDKKGNFVALNHFLRTAFGLETVIVHEALTNNLNINLPHDWFNSLSPYSPGLTTLCFLVSSEEQEKNGTRVPCARNLMFSQNGGSLAFRQVINPASLKLLDNQQLRFSRGLRILGLRPYMAISEVEFLTDPGPKDPESVHLAQTGLSSWLSDHTHSQEQSRKGIRIRVQDYLAANSQALCEQSWPQLMLIAPSTIIVPNY